MSIFIWRTNRIGSGEAYRDRVIRMRTGKNMIKHYELYMCKSSKGSLTPVVIYIHVKKKKKTKKIKRAEEIRSELGKKKGRRILQWALERGQATS